MMQMSKAKAEMIELLKQPKTFLLYRNSDLLSSSRRKSSNTGTWAVKIVRGEEVLIKRFNWRSAEPMLEGGFLALVGERPYKGKLYALTPLADTISQRIRESKLKPAKKMVLSESVKSFAEKYQCSINHVKIHQWFVLSRLDGTKLKNPYIAYDKAGNPVTKLSDMTVEEWEEVIREQSEWVGPCNQSETNTEQADQPPEE